MTYLVAAYAITFGALGWYARSLHREVARQADASVDLSVDPL